MGMPGRKYLAGSGYRYGFNGKEEDPEIEGQQDYGFRIYDKRLGRFKSVDPLTKKYPELTPYQFAGNMPIKFIDLDGLEPAENPTFVSKNEARAIATTTSIAIGAGLHALKENITSSGAWTSGNSEFKGTSVSNKGPINYITDTKGDPENKYNMKVSNSKIFHVDESQAKDFNNYEAFVVDRLINNFIFGMNSENYSFPTNGIISSKFLDSDIFNAALGQYKSNVKAGMTGTVVNDQFNFKAPELARDLYRTGTPFSITGLTGSAKITMVQTDKGVQVTIFNIMSLYSGDATKDLSNSITPSKSFVRRPEGTTRYGNIGITANLFLPSSSPLLK